VALRVSVLRGHVPRGAARAAVPPNVDERTVRVDQAAAVRRASVTLAALRVVAPNKRSTKLNMTLIGKKWLITRAI
jgi:hypothetical protein